MDGRMFDGLGEALVGLFIICCLAVPLALWKLVEIGTWLFHHVHIAIH